MEFQQKFATLLTRLKHLQNDLGKLRIQLSVLQSNSLNPVYVDVDTVLSNLPVHNTTYVLRRGCSTFVLPHTGLSDGDGVRIVNITGSVLTVMCELPVYSFFFAPRGSNVLTIQQNCTLALSYFGGVWTSAI